ncbi:MAG: alpha/beta hydrolase [Parachlamydiales bacterium]|nr:alpha/beta hydrolase [Parachlamydiales bacterium]
MKKKFLIFSVLFVTLFFSAYNVLPYALVKYHTYKSFKDLNLEVKEIKYGKDHFEYIEGGEGPTILFVHGFQSTKSYWVPFIKKFITTHHVVALDLPGHGNSSSPENQKYDIQSLEKSLSKFVQEKKLNKFHLVATSMGGGIASIYAANNPDKLSSLILINPLGIDLEKKSELQILVSKGKNLFFPNNIEEFDELACFCTGKKLSLSNYFKKHILSQMIKNYTFFKRVFKELLSSIPLDNVLPKIKTPSLLIIAQKDRIINPETFEVFIKLIPNAKAKRIKEGSHVLVDKNFDQAIFEIDKFINQKS